MTRLFLSLLFLGLVGALVVLLSQLNSRTYAIKQDGNQLVVHRGRLLPFGTMPFNPSDPRLADAYAPLPVAGQLPSGVVGERFGDREELDRALFQLLAMRAGPLIQSEEREAQLQGLTYLRRAQLLSAITTEQRRALEKLLADAAYFQARLKLDDARRLIAEAMTQLRLAADSDRPQAKNANQMLSVVGPASRQLEEALRRAVYALGEAPPTPVDQMPEEPATEESDAGVSPEGDAGTE